MSQLKSILDVILFCDRCGCSCVLGDAIPCIGPDDKDGTGFGCPQPDCGGIVKQARSEPAASRLTSEAAK